MKGNSLRALVISSLLMGAPLVASYEVAMPAYVEAAAVTAEVDASVGQATKRGGVMVYPTLKSALAALSQQKATSATLRLAPGTYREKVTINVPNLLLIGKDAATTTIVWDDAEGTPVRPEDAALKKKQYKMDCATVTISKKATNFQAVNITFANDFPTEEARVDKRVGGSVQAFALTDEADMSSFYNCRFLGRQDTLYANAGRQYYKNCYIEGDVDFIFGQASAAVFDGCEIKSLSRAVKEDGKSHGMGYVTAPSTLAQDKGYLFYKCHLTGDIPSPHYVMLGRPWHPSSEKREVNSAATFRECQIDVTMKDNAWNSMKNKFATFKPEDNRLFEYKNTGKGAKISKNRRQLTDAQAKDYTVEAFLGDWKPTKRG
ncbi:MAG: hypothetical protein IKN12_09190 [Selenomonadaceae bacterium]|nr:hypothetical protein [Selenomonadaceae bacterium]